MFYERIPSAYGDAGLVWTYRKGVPVVIRILLPGEDFRLEEVARRDGLDRPRESDPRLKQVCNRISAYMKGRPAAFSLSHLDLDLCYEFQKQVLLLLRTVPRGKVVSYSGLALMLGNPGAARAVGTAMARNPFPVIFPCHRVLRSDGSLGGFGGGLKLKRALLEMEGVRFDSKGRVETRYFVAS